MTRIARQEYRSLSRSRRLLKRKLRDARKAHKPTDRIICEMQRVTTAMLVMESGVLIASVERKAA